MSSSKGRNFRVSNFGESLGGAVGVILDGCPPKLKVDINLIQNELDRRRPGQSDITTPRNEGGIGDIKYPLVSDLKREICQAYNVLNDDGEADRGLFLINPEGVVMHTTVNKAPVGRNVDETLRILQGYQYVAANPDEVCPAIWTPGEKTMLEDPKGSKEYLSAL